MEEEDELVQMVRDFIESESTSPKSVASSKQLSPNPQPASLALQEILWRSTDAEVEILDKILMDVKNMESAGEPNILNKWVVMRLKMDGYEASLCKTSWVSTFGHPRGDYEYVDVMIKDKNWGKPTRLIVDMDFRSQFELARPTPTYKEVISRIPSIFVGTEEKLNKIISLLCSAAKQSLKESGLHIPPWRKVSYMHSKWLSKDCKRLSVLPNFDLGIKNSKDNSGSSSAHCPKLGMWELPIVKP